VQPHARGAAMAAAEQLALYHINARGGNKRKTVTAWRTKQGENTLGLSFVEAYGGELAGADGKLVLGKERSFAQACPGAADRSSAAEMLRAQKVQWKNCQAGSASGPTGMQRSMIALTHIAKEGDWVLVKNLKGKCPTEGQQPGERGSLPRVFILGQFASPAVEWHTRDELRWEQGENCPHPGDYLSVRPVVWKRCGNWDTLAQAHPKVCTYLNRLSTPTAAEAKKSVKMGCVEALIGASIEYERELMMPAVGGQYPDAYTQRLTQGVQLAPRESNAGATRKGNKRTKRARKAKSQKWHEEQEEKEEEEEELVIEELLNSRRRNRKETEYLVKWQGYNHSHNSWEPRCNLGSEASRLISALERAKRVGKMDGAKRRIGNSGVVKAATTVESLGQVPSQISTAETSMELVGPKKKQKVTPPQKTTRAAAAAAAAAAATTSTISQTEAHDECVVCMDREKTKALGPCCHLCLCDLCAKKVGKRNGIKDCPICREEIACVLNATQMYK
jgi:hypothetical protein